MLTFHHLQNTYFSSLKYLLFIPEILTFISEILTFHLWNTNFSFPKYLLFIPEIRRQKIVLNEILDTAAVVSERYQQNQIEHRVQFVISVGPGLSDSVREDALSHARSSLQQEPAILFYWNKNNNCFNSVSIKKKYNEITRIPIADVKDFCRVMKSLIYLVEKVNRKPVWEFNSFVIQNNFI